MQATSGSEQLCNFFLGDKPSATAVVHVVAQQLPLNQKQRLLTERIIHGSLTWEIQARDSDEAQQLLMSTEDAGMIQVIKATVAAMTILQRADELMLLAPTGATAYNIGGNTIHHALRTPRLWTSKTVMIVNNASMVNVQTLAKVDNRSHVTRSQSPYSPGNFGGVPVVVVMPDFSLLRHATTLPLCRQVGVDDGEVLKFQRCAIVRSNTSRRRLNQLYLQLSRSSGGVSKNESRDRRGAVRQLFWLPT
jgi:hypothetical protein